MPNQHEWGVVFQGRLLDEPEGTYREVAYCHLCRTYWAYGGVLPERKFGLRKGAEIIPLTPLDLEEA